MDRIIVGQWFPIQPKHIDLSSRLSNTFGKYETEESASVIIDYCRRRGTWVAFTVEEIAQEFSLSSFRFNGLVAGTRPEPNDGEEEQVYLGGWIVPVSIAHYSATDDFILRCYLRHPADSAQGTS